MITEEINKKKKMLSPNNSKEEQKQKKNSNGKSRKIEIKNLFRFVEFY